MISKETQAALIALGQRFKVLRIERNERQSDFAFRLGISVPTLRKLERGDPSVAIGTWIDALWLLNRLDELDQLLAKQESLFDRWDKRNKETPRKRVTKS